MRRNAVHIGGGGCYCGSVAEVSWVRLLVTAALFTFLYFCLITSKYQLLLCCSHHDGRGPGEDGKEEKRVGEERRRGKEVRGGGRGLQML